ncbi:MAG: insulinase family protein [Verrucomicrobia bacterium]|nr:insulinase family protein [Verrucomicrobiota bacterium]
MKLNVKSTTLDNGLRVVTSDMSQLASVAIGIWVGVGGRYETKKLSGISHFIEHLLFKGTKQRSAQQISQAIEGRGGYFNAFTQEESTCYYARITSDHTWSVLDILADMYRSPRLAPADIDKEKGVIIEEIMMYRDQPHHLVQDLLGQLIWSNHALGRPLIGTPRNIINMSRSDIVDFKQRKYVAGNTVVAFAGPVNHEECCRQVQRSLGQESARKAPSYPEVKRDVGSTRAAVERKEIEQSHLALGVRIFGRHDRRRYALKLLSVILGENMSSRLFQVVRERNGLAYSVHSSCHLFDETGAMVISAGLDRNRTERALELICRELRRIREKRVGAGELRRAKDYAIGQLKIGLESTTSQMMWLGENILGYGRIHQPQRAIDRLEAVTTSDIQSLADRLLRTRNISAALVVPEDSPISEASVSRQLAEI